jgi:hypothetical protein
LACVWRISSAMVNGFGLLDVVADHRSDPPQRVSSTAVTVSRQVDTGGRLRYSLDCDQGVWIG